MFLLDANVLIALIDPMNSKHSSAHQWFAGPRSSGWATCPMTENAVLRVIGHTRYLNPLGNPGVVAASLDSLIALPGHEFCPDDISLLDKIKIDLTHLTTPNQVTDTYLLALAVAHGGQLATYDRKILSSAVINGNQALYLIP